MKRFRNIIRYIIVILLNILVMWLFHSYLNFLLLAGLLVFPIYSIIGVRKVQQKARLELKLPTSFMHRGEEFYLRFILYNPTAFPLLNATIKLTMENRFYGDEGLHFLNMPVRAKKDTEVDYPIVMDYCGRFAVKAESIQFTDLLGIYEVTVPLKEEKECLILPDGKERNSEAGQIYIHGVSESMESKEKGYDFSEVSGIREYIPGDKLQNIHWKLSVKKDELMVKERISVSAMQLNVLVDLANDEEMRLEAVLELADSVTKAFVNQNLPFTVYYYSTNFGDLKETYIGNKIERMQWLEMLFYDRSYSESGKVEELFLKEYPTIHSYLYIGFSDGEAENVVLGEKQTAAVLRK